MRHLILKWIVVLLLIAECNFSPFPLQNSVRATFDGTIGVYMQAPIFPLKWTANPSKFPWISSPSMLHLNKSVIRWIAVRWLPNKATQIRVNIDSSESAHDSLWWHHVTTLTTIHIRVLAGGWHRGESRKLGREWEGERSDEAYTQWFTLNVGWCCRLALVSHLLMGWVNPTLLVAVTHPHIRQRAPVSHHLCSHSVFMMICLYGLLLLIWPLSCFMFCSDGTRLNTHAC